MNNEFNDDFELEKTKSISKIISMIILIIIIFNILLIFGRKYVLKIFFENISVRQFHLIEKSISLNKKYVIEIGSNGARWPFCSEDIEIIAYKNTNVGKLNKKNYN